MRKYIIPFCLLLAASCHSYQELDGRLPTMHHVKVSLKEQNRFQIKGERIKRLISPEQRLDLKEGDGVLYGRLLDGEDKSPFSLSIVGESGRHYDLMVLPQDIPMESITIHAPQEKPNCHMLKKGEAIPSFRDRVASYLKACVREEGEPVSLKDESFVPDLGLMVKKAWRVGGHLCLMGQSPLSLSEITGKAHPLILGAGTLPHQNKVVVLLKEGI